MELELELRLAMPLVASVGVGRRNRCRELSEIWIRRCIGVDPEGEMLTPPSFMAFERERETWMADLGCRMFVIKWLQRILGTFIYNVCWVMCPW